MRISFGEACSFRSSCMGQPPAPPPVELGPPPETWRPENARPMTDQEQAIWDRFRMGSFRFSGSEEVRRVIELVVGFVEDIHEFLEGMDTLQILIVDLVHLNHTGVEPEWLRTGADAKPAARTLL